MKGWDKDVKKTIIKLFVFTVLISGFIINISALQSSHYYRLPGSVTITVHAYWDNDGTNRWFSVKTPDAAPHIYPETEAFNPNPKTLEFKARATWMTSPGNTGYGKWGEYIKWVSPYGSTRSSNE